MNIVSTPHPVLFLISAPSGAGKTTLCHRLLGECPKLKYSVSSTTRPPREGEIAGVDYDFLSREEFDQSVAEGNFLEYAEVHGNGYGTRLETLNRFFKAGYSVLMDVDVQGAAHIRRNLKNDKINSVMRDSFVDVFISPPSLLTLRERLEGRAKDAAEVIEKRLKNAADEMSQADLYEFQIINDSLDAAYDHLLAVYKASTLKTILI